MTEEKWRDAIVAEALSWDGTRFKDHARVKIQRDAEGRVIERGGVDCAQLLYCVFHACGLTPSMPLIPYSPQWFLHRSEEQFLETVLSAGAQPTDSPKRGDVVLYRVGRCFAHGAIILNPGWPSVIHAIARAGRVMCDTGDTGMMQGRPRRFFTMWKPDGG